MERTKTEQAFRDLTQLVNDRWQETDSDAYSRVVKLLDIAKEMFNEEEGRQCNSTRAQR